MSASSAKRKRGSAPISPVDSSSKRAVTRARTASAASADDPPTLVTVAPPPDGQWCVSMQRTREAGNIIDVTMLVDGRKIYAHKAVIASLSPYLNGLLTCGLAESNQDELTLGDGNTDIDGRAVEAIVDCMYSGQLLLSRSTVTGIIRTSRSRHKNQPGA